MERTGMLWCATLISAILWVGACGHDASEPQPVGPPATLQDTPQGPKAGDTLFRASLLGVKDCVVECVIAEPGTGSAFDRIEVLLLGAGQSRLAVLHSFEGFLQGVWTVSRRLPNGDVAATVWVSGAQWCGPYGGDNGVVYSCWRVDCSINRHGTLAQVQRVRLADESDAVPLDLRPEVAD